MGLVSGGKDSFYNIHECIENSHELIALANLYPSRKVDEIDSFMFQTVGYNVVDYYEKCLEVPLYRQEIKGNSSNQSLEYSVTQGDEIEDLYNLLKRVKDIHPDLEAVSCGAILSNYQRTRVENVCYRLGLTCLAYLWQRDQYELMSEMCRYGLDARIIKVAAIGLDSKDLGKSIQEIFPKLIKLNQMYDVHICGEGGEFETIVLDAPFFRSKRLAIAESQIVEHSNDNVGYLKVDVELVDKKNDIEEQTSDHKQILEESFQEIFNSVPEELADTKLITKIIRNEMNVQPCLQLLSETLHFSNVIGEGLSIVEQSIDIFSQLRKVLEINNYGINEVQHVTLLLADMKDFEAVNEIYEKEFCLFFLPPSRICIATSLPENRFVQMSFSIMKRGKKGGIHVRSRSYWAPQNIGPYSQCIVQEMPTYCLATVSGQIPLIPATMLLNASEHLLNSLLSSVLALQHLHKVKQLVQVSNVGHVTCFMTDPGILNLVTATWHEYLKELQIEYDHPRATFVLVLQLPKNASVEWGGICYKEIKDMYEDDEEIKQIQKSFFHGLNDFESSDIYYIQKANLSVCLNYGNDWNSLCKFVKSMENQRAYIQISMKSDEINRLEGNFEILPVLQVWDSSGNPYNYAAFCIMESNKV